MRLPIAIAATLLVGASGPPSPPAPVVVELFTSQGCSSCPPADAYAEQLAKRADLVIVTRPVTYWDRLGWKDTLGREANTTLQRAYATRGGEGAGVYTPQTMVQGKLGAVGSKRDLVAQQIDRARKDISAAIAVRPGLIAIDGKGAPAEVKLISVRREVVVRIGSGENGGRTIRYSNVVIDERTIGQWKGGPQSFATTPAPKGADRQAVIVQRAGSGPILAARWI